MPTEGSVVQIKVKNFNPKSVTKIVTVTTDLKKKY